MIDNLNKLCIKVLFTFVQIKKKVKGDIDNYNDNNNDKKNDPGAKNMLCLWLEASKDS